MAKPFDDTFVGYYQKELSYLREAGLEFSKAYPALGKELGLLDTTSADPHVERLIESFAFLTARMNQEIQDQLPDIAHHLLEELYPPFVEMRPACGIAQFNLDVSKNFSSSGVLIEKSSPLWALGEKDQHCKFQTVYPLTLWPVTLNPLALSSCQLYDFLPLSDHGKRALVVRLSFPFDSPKNLKMDHLTFHLSGDFFQALALYEAFFSDQSLKIYVKDEHGTIHKDFKFLPKGFDKSETLAPHANVGHVGYELLLDYFHFPQKYLFFDLKGPWSNLEGKEIEIIIPLGKSDFLTPDALSNALSIGTTPIINLFKKTADPIKLDHKSLNYRLSPDQRRETTTEVFRVLEAYSILNPQDDPKPLAPFYHFSYKTLDSSMFWIAKREASWQEHLPGSSIYLNFVDKKFNPLKNTQETIYVKTLCTNRFLSESLSAKTKLYYDQTLPVSSIVLRDKPVNQHYAPKSGETLWRLVGLLKSYHRPLLEHENALSTLKEMLGLFCTSFKQGEQELQTLTGLNCTRVTKRLGKEAWRGFVEGLRVDLTVNRTLEAGQKSFLFASVLRHFFAQTIALGGFVELCFKSQDSKDESITWQALENDQLLR